MTGRDLGAVLARVTSIYLAVNAVHALAPLPPYVLAFGEKYTPTRYDWITVATWVFVAAVFGFSALLLWVNAGKFWPNADEASVDARSLQRVALTVLGFYLALIYGPSMIQTIVLVTVPDTDLAKVAFDKFSVWDAVANGCAMVCGIALILFNRQPDPKDD